MEKQEMTSRKMLAHVTQDVAAEIRCHRVSRGCGSLGDDGIAGFQSLPHPTLPPAAGNWTLEWNEKDPILLGAGRDANTTTVVYIPWLLRILGIQLTLTVESPSRVLGSLHAR